MVICTISAVGNRLRRRKLVSPKHALVYTTKEKTAVKYQMPACFKKKEKKAVTALSCVSILVKQVARLQSPQLIKVTKAEKENETETCKDLILTSS